AITGRTRSLSRSPHSGSQSSTRKDNSMGVRVAARYLSVEAFGPFGEIAQVSSGTPPNLKGPTWNCWYPIARIPGSLPLLLGLVETGPLSGEVTLMERHEGRVEVVIALDRPILQVVAPATTRLRRPMAKTVRAFVVRPGESVILAPGTWHAAAATADDNVSRYLFGLPESSDSDVDSGWTTIDGGAVAVDLAVRNL
ncbi:MAG: ureidoglycolate lyase, partial [Fimbriimonadales bacterium]